MVSCTLLSVKTSLLLLVVVVVINVFVVHVVQGQECTPDEILLDFEASDPTNNVTNTCANLNYLNDGICDGGGPCPLGEDCVDCDPCRDYNTDCQACQEQGTDFGCLYCPSTLACVSADIANVYTDICAEPFVEPLEECPPPPTVQCTVEEIQQDFLQDPETNPCAALQWLQDGLCDVRADGSGSCPLGTDCYDCDPCEEYRDSCSSCITTDGCLYSAVEGACRSQDILDVYGGQGYSNECPVCDYTLQGGGGIGAESNTCFLSYDGYCDQEPTIFDDGFILSPSCAEATDCFDCDPCRAWDFTSCGECTAQNCVWCSTDALCTSGNLVAANLTSLGGKSFGCQADTIATMQEQCDGLVANNPFPDPLYSATQWIFDLINVQPVWEMGITGSGIGIRINDDGVDANHPDIADKFDVTSSCPNYLPPTLDEDNSHGTQCAALAAAASNDVCSVGIAPGAMLSGCAVLDGNTTDDNFAELTESILFLNMERMDISSNSYGLDGCYQNSFFRRRRLQECPFLPGSAPCLPESGCDWSLPDTEDLFFCEQTIGAYCTDPVNYENDVAGCGEFLDIFVSCEYRPNDQEKEALRRGVTEGRGGKGIIFTFASGNAYGQGDDTNFQGNLINTRYTIKVGAVGKDGLHSSYSTPGAGLHVSAPGGDDESFSNNPVALAGGGCLDATVGTSFANPVVAGVIALVLEANPELSWRDVQGVIAATSTKMDPDDPSWVTNAAGYSHSNLYGFGIINAHAAVEAAQSWEIYTPETMIAATSGPINLTIPEFTPATDPIETELTVRAGDNFFVETVNVFVRLDHSTRGDLTIILTSPTGTVSLLHPAPRPENGDFDLWKLVTVKHWGESPTGVWKLSIEDSRPGDLVECVDDEYIYEYSSEFFVGNLTCDDFVGYCSSDDQTQFINGEVVTGPSDSFFTSFQGTTPAQACCACGGGMPPEQNLIPDILQEWTIAVYGHSMADSASPTLSPPGIAPTPSPGGDDAGDSPTIMPAGMPDGDTTTDSPTKEPAAMPDGTTDPTLAPQGPSSSSRLSTFGLVLVTLVATAKGIFGY